MKYDRRRFLRNVALTLAVTERAILGSAAAQSNPNKPVSYPSAKPGTDATCAPLKKRLAASPAISVPTITLEGDANGAPHPDAADYARKFTGKYAHRIITGGVGHNLPQEAPQAFAQAVLDVAKQGA